MEELTKQNEPAAKGKIILAHLGSGASMAAVKDGKCIDTTMGFTPAGGIVMSTRSGDLDPGVSWYFMKQGMDAKAFNNLINHQSGLLGISGLSGDMEALIQQESENEDAALAIAIFCYQIQKQIGAFAAALGGVETLVFSGGIGENAPEIRSRICEGLGFLGIEIDEKQNKTNAPIVSKSGGNTTIRVIHTDEEWMIAKTVNQKITSFK
jgi:acetate kinase